MLAKYDYRKMWFKDWLLEELFFAYLEARRGKRKTMDENVFEMNAVENLMRLRDAIITKKYVPSRGIAFITRKPVVREIFAAPFIDRVVHHLLFNAVADWWDRRLIHDCYSCRPGKGTWFGIHRAQAHFRRASDNWQKRAYVVKLDIQGYFMSLPRAELYKRICWGLDLQYPEKDRVYNTLKFLWRKIIFDDPTRNAIRRGPISDWDALPRSKSLFCQPPGKGIVIGNLSSQLLSNIYLDRLDRFVTEELGYRCYGRYVDDFYIVVPEEQFEQLKLDLKKIEELLGKMGLVLHPRKRYCQEIHKGLAFLGAVIYPDRIVPGKRIKRNFYEAARQVEAGEKEIQSLVSYMGQMVNMRGRKLTSEVFESVGWEYEW